MSDLKELASKQEVLAPGRTDTVALLDVISRAASDPDTDVTKLERLMAMYERLEGQKAKQAFDAAMASAQKEMEHVRTDANNTQTKSKYATYGALDRVIRPIYSKHGFGLSFDTGDGAPQDYVRVVCDVSHSGGHSKSYHIDMPADGKGAKGGDVMTKTHAVGSAMSYGQRYLLKAIFNIVVSDDDDGNKAGTTEFITPEQVAEIQDLMDKANADPEKFVQFMGVDAVMHIPGNRHRKAFDALNQAIADLEKKRTKKP